MKRKPHPARGSRITTLGVSTTAFVSIVTSLAWNTHQTELAANAAPVQQLIPLPEVAATAQTPVTAMATIAPVAPAVPTITSTPSKPGAPTVAPATPVVPTTPVAPTAQPNVAIAPAAPAATVMYTCMSPGGKTENPTATGACKNAKYGYVLTQI
jgi:hypothetical protein